MKRYEAYKAVQPLWNMTFPKHWEVFPLYSIAKEKSICNCTELELLSVYLDAGVVPFSKRTEKRTNATSKDLSKYQRVDPGDFVLNNQYVDKGLADIKAVQTLSRLNRSHPDKKDTFILDFVNEPGVIKEAFDRYYKTTILSGETDVNKLNDLIDTMESIQVYSDADIDTFVERYLANEPREHLDPILDHCVEVYKGLIIEDQIEFKSCAKTFVRTYNFLSAILPYGSVQWEKLSIFLNLLVPKLPKPDGEDYTEGLLEDVDLESYRAEAQQTMRIQLENENGKIDPIPVSTSVGIDVPELDTLTNILKEFHDIFGNIEWTDEDKIKKQINDIIESVRRDEKYNNAMQFSDKQNARDESDRAAHEAVMNSMQSGLELFREVQNNPSFRKWLFDSAFNSTYQANHNQTSL